MSSSKRNKKWKEKVLENFLKRGKFTEGSIYKFQDQITLTDCPNDVPLQRERVFEKTVYRISKIDKEDIIPLFRKSVYKQKNLNVTPDQCELIAEIDKNLKHLKKQKRFIKMERDCRRTWDDHLSANEYAREKNYCNQRSSLEQYQTGCGAERVDDALQKLIDRNRVKVADSYTQIESPICHKRCESGGDYYSWQCGTNEYPPQCDYNEGGYTYDSLSDAEWKAGKNNCNFRTCPTEKVKPKFKKLPPCCNECPKPQKRASVCDARSQGSSPRFTTAPHTCSDYISTVTPRGRPRTKDYHSDDCQDRFETTYMASYGPQADQNYATGRSKGESLREKDSKTKRVNTKPKNSNIFVKPHSPRLARKPREDSVERDLKRMPFEPEKLCDEIEKCICGVRRKSPVYRDFIKPSASHITPQSPRKVGTITQVQKTIADLARCPRSRSKPTLQKPCRSYSQVASSTPRKGESCTQQRQSRANNSAKYRESLRQTTKTTQPNYSRSKSHISPRYPSKIVMNCQISQPRGLDWAKYKQSPRRRTESPERSPSLTPRKLGPRQVSQTKDLGQSSRQRNITPESKYDQSDRNLYSKITKSHQIIQSNPLYSLRNKNGQNRTYEIYEKKTKVEQCCFKRQTHETVEKEKREKTYKQSPQESYEVLETENLQDVEVEDYSNKSPINDLSETSSTARLRKYNIIKPNVIDDSTYVYPEDVDTEDYIIVPYCRMTLEEEQTTEHPVAKPEQKNKLSESLIKKSEVILEDASNASIAQMEERAKISVTSLPQSHQVKEIYYKLESKRGPAPQYETKEMMYKIESNRERQINDVISHKPHPIEEKEINPDTVEVSSLIEPQFDTKEMFYMLESTRIKEIPLEPIPEPQYETKDEAYKSVLSHEPQSHGTTHSRKQHHDHECQTSDLSLQRSYKAENDSPTNRSYQSQDSESARLFKQEPNLAQQVLQQEVKAKSKSYPSQTRDSSSSQSNKSEKDPSVKLSHGSVSPKTSQQEMKTKSETWQSQMRASSSTSSRSKKSENQEPPLKSSYCQTNGLASPQSYKSEKKELPLKPKPFRSEMKEEKPSDQEFKSYEQVSKEMSNHFQSSKILSEVGSPQHVPTEMEDHSIVKQESGSHTSETSQEFLSEAPNLNEPIKGIDSELLKFVQYLQNRLRDCDNMVQKQFQKKNVCPKVYDGDKTGQQIDGAHQYLETSHPTYEHDSRAQQKDIRHSPSIKTQTEAEDESGFYMKEEDISELIIPLDSDRATESDLEFEDECHCYRCEEDKLSPIATEIPPFTGCDCMKEDYYKIMRVVYNK